jgi:hypothetical protein
LRSPRGVCGVGGDVAQTAGRLRDSGNINAQLVQLLTDGYEIKAAFAEAGVPYLVLQKGLRPICVAAAGPRRAKNSTDEKLMSVRRLADDQPASFAFTPENQAWAQKLIAKYPQGKQASAVIPLLWRAQEQHDYWLPKAAIETSPTCSA